MRYLGLLLGMLLMTLIGCGNNTLFLEDFEKGTDQWEIPGSMVITTISAFSGSHCQTFSKSAGGGDAFTSTFSVTPGRTYYLHLACMSLGGSGFVGVDLITDDPVTLREQWLIGADSQALSQFDAKPGIWKVYTQSYTVPDNITRIRIKAEDSRVVDPKRKGVFFDNIEWSTNPKPSF